MKKLNEQIGAVLTQFKNDDDMPLFEAVEELNKIINRNKKDLLRKLLQHAEVEKTYCGELNYVSCGYLESEIKKLSKEDL